MYSCTITVLSKKHIRGAYWKRGAYWDEGACLIGAPIRTGGTYKGPKNPTHDPSFHKGGTYRNRCTSWIITVYKNSTCTYVGKAPPLHSACSSIKAPSPDSIYLLWWHNPCSIFIPWERWHRISIYITKQCPVSLNIHLYLLCRSFETPTWSS